MSKHKEALPQSPMKIKRFSLYTLILIAPVAWGGLLLFTHFVPPQAPLAFLIFFLILIAALVCTLSPIAYFVGSRMLAFTNYRPTMQQSLRQGTLLTLVIVLNLLLRALHSWNIFMAIVLLGIAVVIEILALARKQ